MGKVDKGQSCSVVGCNSAAIRSISTDKVAHTGLNIGNARRAFLCKATIKSSRSLQRKIDRLTNGDSQHDATEDSDDINETSIATLRSFRIYH